MNKIGIIGYGSMGRMLLEKFSEAGKVNCNELFISNRTISKIAEAPEKYTVCSSNITLAKSSDTIFICTRPKDILQVLQEISGVVSEDTLIVSLNGSILFEALEKVKLLKLAKVIPSVTAEINRSQTLVTYNSLVTNNDKEMLRDLLSCIGSIIELPESEMGMESELVSCMPGFIASIFDVICKSAKKHTTIPESQIINMVLNTLCSTGELMLQKDIGFEEVVSRVATKGGITEVGSRVIYDGFPCTADEMFEKTLAKRREISLEYSDMLETVCLLTREGTTHNMKLNHEPFEMIKSGKKTIELRLYDEKRQKINVGDSIVFTETVTGEKLSVKVEKLHRFDSFEELYKSLPLLKCGYTEKTVTDAKPSDMEEYYSAEEQRKYGVVGIEISLQG